MLFRNCREVGELMHQRLATLIAAASAIFAVACGQSDPGITAALKARLIEDASVKAYQSEVDQSNSVVTLSGAVETSAAKERAVTLARETGGVRDVVDRITIDPQGASVGGGVSDDIEKVGQKLRENTQQAADAAK